MDEIDNIILHSLRQIGCNLDEDVTSLDEFSPSLLVQVVSKCVALIDPSLDLPKTLPPGMAQRFTATASLAEACRSIGYRRDIGYQTFLYSNVTEVRRVLMFLIERLPKEVSDKATSGQPLSDTTELENQIITGLQSQLQAPWMPEFCRTTSDASQAQIAFRRFVPRRINIPFVTQSDVTAEIKQFWSRHTFAGLNEDNLIPSVIAANDGALKSNVSGAIDEVDRKLPSPADRLLQFCSATSGTANQFELVPSKNATEDPKKQSQESAVGLSESSALPQPSKTSIETLQEEIDRIRAEIEQNVEDGFSLENNRRKVVEAQDALRVTVGKLKEEKKIKERTHILLEDPEVNVKKLEGIIAAGGERMKKLQDQWDTHRTPLVETLEGYRLKNSDKLSKSQQILDQTETTRQKCEEVIIDLQTKSAMHARLQKEFEKLSKTVSRTAYTSRILEIIGNIRKQKTDIDKILQDTRTLQKEINTITGQLDRQFTVTDDLIFRNAKKDEHAKKAYKLLVTLHSDCAELTGLVQETGSIKREIRDLEDQIENEKSRNTAANLSQITHDLTEMQKESQRLEESLRRHK